MSFALGIYVSPFPAQLLQFSLLFDCTSRRTLQLRARLACRSLFERKIRGLRRAEPCGTPFWRCNKHIFTRIETAVRHLYAFLSLVGLAPSFAVFSFSPSCLAFLFRPVFMRAVNLQKPFFCYWSGSFWVGLCASAGTDGALQYISHSFHQIL